MSTDQETTPVVGEFELSYTQEFLCLFGTGEEHGAFGPRYHAVRGWRLQGEPNLDALSKALLEVVRRHESLRTYLDYQADPPVQRVYQPSPPELIVQDITEPDPANRGRRAEEFLNGLETVELSVRQIPHLRAVLGRLDAQDWVLALVTHHVSTDGWSMERLIHEVSACYAAYEKGTQPTLAPVPSYREFTAWQRKHLSDEVVEEACAYWRAKLDGAKMLGLPNDRTRIEGGERASAVYRFVIEAELGAAVQKLARTTRSSAFMVLLTVESLLLSQRTGVPDVVLPTITFGRGPDYEATVGPFFNFVPMRIDLSGCDTFEDAFARTRATCLEAQTHEVPFAFVLKQSPELMSAFGELEKSVCAFQTFQFAHTKAVPMGSLTLSEIRHRVLSQAVGSDIPDGYLWTLEIDPTGEIYGSLRYDSKEFDEASMATMAAEYTEVLRRLIQDPSAPITAV